jgi:hypothetical protein
MVLAIKASNLTFLANSYNNRGKSGQDWPPYFRTMIRQSIQKRCVWAAVAVFSVIAVAGNGLHFMPGLEHDCREPHRQFADCENHRLSDGSEEFSSAEMGGRESSPAISVSRNCDDCPVCQYFTQAQSVPLAVAFEIDSRAVESNILTIRPPLVDRTPDAYCSRAPPSCG